MVYFLYKKDFPQDLRQDLRQDFRMLETRKPLQENHYKNAPAGELLQKFLNKKTHAKTFQENLTSSLRKGSPQDQKRSS